MISFKRYGNLITQEAVYPSLLSASQFRASHLYTKELRRLRRLRRLSSASFIRTYHKTFNSSCFLEQFGSCFGYSISVAYFICCFYVDFASLKAASRVKCL